MGRRKDWRKPPFYVVCGMPRGGTSMMMQALIAGGMEAFYTDQREAIKADAELGFKSNPVDTYEWTAIPKKLPRKLRGKLIKLFPWHMTEIEPGPFKVCFVKRKAEDVKASLKAYLDFASSQPGQNNKEIEHAHQVAHDNNLDVIMPQLAMVLSHDPRIQDVNVVDYDDVCSRPKEVFSWLHEKGWPINPVAAAAVPNKEWRQER